MNNNSRVVSEKRKTIRIMERGHKARKYSTIQVAEIGRQIKFDPATLDALAVNGCKQNHYDLIVICAAIEFADRRFGRSSAWGRSFEVIIPVIDLETWGRPEVKEKLVKVVNYLTGDDWKFTFYEARDQSPVQFRQGSLDLGDAKAFAVAYSDGLDSRAVSALCGSKDEALCIRIASRRQKPKLGDSYFTQIPFRVEEFRSNESSFRSRGFQFASITAIAAHLKGVTRIVVPESGQGALGPVLLPFYKIYPDFRNYPLFFRKMEEFLGEALGHLLVFDQPRIWSTKGETLSAFLQVPGKTKEDLIETRSCWQSRWIVNIDGEKKQCGLCAACLLRRMSLRAAGVEEPSGAYVVSALNATDVYKAMSDIPRAEDKSIMIEYGMAGVRHLQDLAKLSEQPDEALRGYASEISRAMGEDYSNVVSNLRAMLIVHAQEWGAFLSELGEGSFLMGWLEGGRYG